MGKLTGKYAIITGAGKGIGAGVAKVFVAEDVAGLAIVDMDIELAQKTAKELDPTGTRVFAFQCNVANYEQVEKVFGEIEAKFGRIDALVNSAGINAGQENFAVGSFFQLLAERGVIIPGLD